MLRLIPAATRVPTPWKNGGGITTELAIHPADAGIGDFAWRLSIAEVAADGPFSAFPGVARTLMLLDGAGMRLEWDGHASVVDGHFAQCTFSGDARVHAHLLDGPVRDCNLMVRRPGRGTLRVVDAMPAELPSAGHCAVHVLHGNATVAITGGRAQRLDGGDTLQWDAAATPVARLVADVGSLLLVATIEGIQ